MNPERIPVIGPLIASGTGNRVFDTFMLLGPVIIVLAALLGRNPVTTALAGAYIGGFVGYVGYRGMSR